MEATNILSKNKTTNNNQHEQTQKIKEEQHGLLNILDVNSGAPEGQAVSAPHTAPSVTRGNDQSPVNVKRNEITTRKIGAELSVRQTLLGNQQIHHGDL